MSQLTIFLDGSIFNSYFGEKIYNLGIANRIFHDETESLYDWVIIEAIRKATESKVMHHVAVDNHINHDVYRCVYDEIGAEVEDFVIKLFHTRGIEFLRNTELKILVTYRDIFIVIKTPKIGAFNGI